MWLVFTTCAQRARSGRHEAGELRRVAAITGVSPSFQAAFSWRAAPDFWTSSCSRATICGGRARRHEETVPFLDLEVLDAPDSRTVGTLGSSGIPLAGEAARGLELASLDVVRIDAALAFTSTLAAHHVDDGRRAYVGHVDGVDLLRRSSNSSPGHLRARLPLGHYDA